MSHLSHPRISSHFHVSRRTMWLGALLALVATGAVVLILAIGNDSTDDATSVSAPSQPSLRSDGGPEETGVAASVGSRPSTGPSESSIAAAVGAASVPVSSTDTSGSSESRIASAVGGSPSQSSSGPDESSVAASLSDQSPPRHAGPDEASTAASISGR